MKMKNEMNLSLIDKEISDYVLQEVKTKSHGFIRVFNNNVVNNCYYVKDPFYDGCFAEILNKSYEQTIQTFKGQGALIHHSINYNNKPKSYTPQGW